MCCGILPFEWQGGRLACLSHSQRGCQCDERAAPANSIWTRKLFLLTHLHFLCPVSSGRTNKNWKYFGNIAMPPNWKFHLWTDTCTSLCSPPSPSGIGSKCAPSASPLRTPPYCFSSPPPSLTRTSGCAGGIHSLHLNAGISQRLLLHPSRQRQPWPCLKQKKLSNWISNCL